MRLREWKRRTTAASFSFKSAQADSSKLREPCAMLRQPLVLHTKCLLARTCNHLACEEAERRPSTELLIKASNYSPVVSFSAILTCFWWAGHWLKTAEEHWADAIKCEHFYFLFFLLILCRVAVSDGGMINSKTPARRTSALANVNFDHHDIISIIIINYSPYIFLFCLFIMFFL